MEDFVFNPINDKKPSGACAINTVMTYTLKVSKFFAFDKVYFVMHRDGEESAYYEMTREYTDERYVYMQYSHKFDSVGHYWYHFEVKTNEDSIKLIRNDKLDIQIGVSDNDYLQLVFDEESHVDKCFKKGIIYHIFVDRFNRVGDIKCRNGLTLCNDWEKDIEIEYNENGDRVNNICYGGNLAGIIEKLSYLKSMNVGTIYLSPVMEANSNHKYDIADYSKIDSMFGGNEAFEELIKKAKHMGISIIIDGVFNHTGSDSVYFNRYGRYRTVGAYQSKNSKYYSWYNFRNWPDDYDCWWNMDVKNLPQTEENSGFFDYIAGRGGIIEKYMSMGIGGFRLDVVDELSNNFLHEICVSARRVNKKAFIIGEVWEDASTKISYSERKNYFLGGNLDSVTNYPMKNAILNYIKYGDVNEFVQVVNFIKDQYPKNVQNNLMNILDTHDSVRAITYLGASTDFDSRSNYLLSEEEKERGIKLLKLATIMQYTVMGLPTVFYGDEAGVEGGGDPFCRRTYPWGKENTELIDWYKNLGNIRNNKVLIDGDMNIKYAQDGVIIYERVKDDNKVIVAVNKSQDNFTFSLTRAMQNFFDGKYTSGKITIAPDDAIILI